MKKLGLAIVALSLLATSALAQKNRSNKSGAMRGDERAAQVQADNRQQDKDRDPSASINKTHGKHKAKGHKKH